MADKRGSTMNGKGRSLAMLLTILKNLRATLFWMFNFGDQNPFLVGGIPTPLKTMRSSVGMIIPNIWENKKCSKPPTRFACAYDNNVLPSKILQLGWFEMNRVLHHFGFHGVGFRGKLKDTRKTHSFFGNSMGTCTILFIQFWDS